MSERMPEWLPERVNNAQYDRIRFLLNKLTLDSKENFALDHRTYPRLLSEYSYERAELYVQDKQVIIDLMHPPDAKGEQQFDTYIYFPAERLVVRGVVVSNHNEQIVAWQQQREELHAQHNDLHELVENIQEEMIEALLKTDEYSAIFNDYDALNKLIEQWRLLVYDTDEANEQWQHSLATRQSENDARIVRVFARHSLVDSEFAELLERYRNARLDMKLKEVQIDILTDQIYDAMNVRTTEADVVNPQYFIEVLNMLVRLARTNQE